MKEKQGIMNFDLDFHFQKTGFKVVSKEMLHTVWMQLPHSNIFSSAGLTKWVIKRH